MNLKKCLLIGAIAILAIISCGKKDEAKDETEDIQIEQESENNATVQEPQNTTTQEAKPAEGTPQVAETKPENAKNSKTLQHVDKILGKEIPLDDRLIKFTKTNDQYTITYETESENGLSTETKDLKFDEKNDSLSDGTYIFKINKNKLGLYSGKQFLFAID